jgi:predicted transcriptional regulator
MKAKKVTVGIRSTEEVLTEAAATMKAVAAGRVVKPKRRRLFFTSPDALRRFLTPKRIDLIHLIRQHHPASIHELATLAQRDFKRVYEDVQALAETGLLELSQKEGRKVTPHVAEELRLEVVL